MSKSKSGKKTSGVASKRAGRRPKSSRSSKDARSKAKAVVELMGATQTLTDFLTTAGELSLEERDLISDQAMVMLDALYCKSSRV